MMMPRGAGKMRARGRHLAPRRMTGSSRVLGPGLQRDFRATRRFYELACRLFKNGSPKHTPMRHRLLSRRGYFPKAAWVRYWGLLEA